MNSQDIVLRYVASLGWCLEALRFHFVGIAREVPTEPLTARTVHGEGRRSGRLEGLGTFKLHGVGCRVEFDSGEEVDFDWDEKGDAIFDAWRLRTFARSIGFEGIDEVDLVAACSELVAAGMLVEIKCGWYGVRS